MNISLIPFFSRRKTPSCVKPDPLSSLKQKFPSSSFCEKDGWRMVVEFKGVFSEFVMGIGQSGSPKGTITLSGHGYEVSVGNKYGRCPCCSSIGPTLPINIDPSYSMQSHVDLLQNEFMNKYEGLSVDRQTVIDLLRDTLRPYSTMN